VRAPAENAVAAMSCEMALRGTRGKEDLAVDDALALRSFTSDPTRALARSTKETAEVGRRALPLRMRPQWPR